MATNRSKASKPKAGKLEANAEEKPTPDPGQNPVSRLKALGGGDCDQWNSRISQRLFLAMPGVNPEADEARWRQGEERRRRNEAIVAQRRKLVGEGKPPILDDDAILDGSPTWPLIERWDALSPDERERVTECWIAEQKNPFSALAKMERG